LFNGVIYAEGNARVRGAYTGTRPLTIVSMGNIYIEGDLRRGAGQGRIALLARKNVVLNPTQFITRVQGAQDRVVADYAFANITTTTGSSTTTLNLASPGGSAHAPFRVGDKIRVGDDDLTWRTITQVNASPSSLVIEPALSAAPADGSKIRLLTDPKFVSGKDTTIFPDNDPAENDDFQVSEYFYRLVNKHDVLARDVKFDVAPAASSYLLSLRSAGERKRALNIRMENAPAGNYNMRLSENNNAIAPNAVNNTTIEPVELMFVGKGVSSTTHDFTYNLRSVLNPPGTLGEDSTQTIAALRTRFNAEQYPPSDPPQQKWTLEYPTPYPGAANNVHLDSAAGYYYYRTGGEDKQQWLRWVNRALPTAPSAGSNHVALAMHHNAGPIAPLHYGTLRAESDNFEHNTPGSRAYAPRNIEVQAQIFVQEGAWFVIAPPLQHRIDVDSNGITDDVGDVALATRMLHAGYRVIVTGSIAQNYAPSALIDYDREEAFPNRSTAGPMSLWLNAMAHPTQIEHDGDALPRGRGRDWQFIIYNPDPDPFRESLDAPLPPTPDIELIN
jgi:hypothetical protein